MKKNLRIGVDIDDVLLECTSYAVELANSMGSNISLSSITGWGKSGTETDVIFDYFDSEDFYRTQPVIEGAKEFISELAKRGELFIVTAINPRFASIRAQRILDEFPEVKPSNIILTERKDVVELDVLIDDAMHNIVETSAKYPICIRQPWNMSYTGGFSVDSYDEAISFVDSISKREELKLKGKIVCLVGPSGSGKTTIAEALAATGKYKIPQSTTTRTQRVNEPDDAYNFVSLEEFEKLQKNGAFLETTVYASNRYGTTTAEIDSIINEGLSAVMPIDICGANKIKMLYKDMANIVYVKRSKKDLFDSLLQRIVDEPNEDRKGDVLNRILAYDSEKKNIDICDSIIVNNKPIAEIVENF